MSLHPKPPLAPTGLKIDSVSVTTTDISWNPVVVDGGIKEYEIYRNGNKVGTSVTLSYHDTGLTAETTYKYKVKAVANNGLSSGFSSELSVATVASGG